MKILTRILGALAGLVIVLAIVGLFLPSTVTVERSTRIDAPPATVFALLNGYRHFNRFSPWADRDPDAEYEYSGPDEGVGATMEWQSDRDGSGRQEIIESVPHERIVTELAFGEDDTAESTFTLQPADDGTDLAWSFQADFGYNLFGRYLGLMFDTWLGADYEQGLANLKKIAESYPDLDLAGFDIREIEVEETPLILTRKRTSMTLEDMQASMASAFAALDTVLQLNQLEPAGPPRIITREWDESGGTWTFDAAYPLSPASPVTRSAPGISRENSHAGPALTVTLEGADWQESSMAYEKAELYMKLHGYEPDGDSWETYESDPVATPADELVTHIVFPVTNEPLR